MTLDCALPRLQLWRGVLRAMDVAELAWVLLVLALLAGGAVLLVGSVKRVALGLLQDEEVRRRGVQLKAAACGKHARPARL